jgi:diadenosine tetraphosphate (Ap4A) HIT family hydrolase
LIAAAKIVAKKMEKGLGVKRIGMVLEGTGVAHVHVKLYPMHGKLGEVTDVWPKHQEFYPEYAGYISTVEGPRMRDDELNKIQKKIQEADA